VNTKLDCTHDCAAEHLLGRMQMANASTLGETGRGPEVNRESLNVSAIVTDKEC